MNLTELVTGISQDTIAKEAVIREAKKSFPLLMYDRVPAEFDEEGNLKNKELVSALNAFQKQVIYGLDPEHKPLVLGYLPNGVGKASRLSTLVATPDGFTEMRNIKKGSVVLTPDGKRAKVLQVFPQGKVDIYRVSFSDGTHTDCTKEHLWQTKYYDNNLNKHEGIFTTEEISKSLTINRGKSYRYQIPILSKMDFEHREVTLDPYLLGLFIGNGYLGCDGLMGVDLTTQELEIKEYVEQQVNVTRTEVRKNNVYQMNVYDGDFDAKLIKLGLKGHRSYHKFIPREYLFNSEKIRLEMLRGLMDPGRSISLSEQSLTKAGKVRAGNSKRLEYSTSSEQLANDVAFLARSLGGIAIMSSRVPRFTYKGEKKEGRISYRIRIMLPDHINPFKLKRKADIYSKYSTKFRPRMIVGVEKVDKDEAQCILIDHPDHLYIVDDCIVTHNTYCIGLSLALALTDQHPSLDLKGITGDIWLLSNSNLMKTVYPDMFFKDPAFLGRKEVYDKQGYCEIPAENGKCFHKLKLIRDGTDIVGIENTTNGKNIRFFTYAMNMQKFAGAQPLSIFCDEMGDATFSSKAVGANKFTREKFFEMAVRCGRNYKVDKKWVFCLFFTLTLGEPWIEDLIDTAREGKAIIPGINNDEACVMLIDNMRTKDNPFISRSTIDFAFGLGNLLGMGQEISRRLISTDSDDPHLVFPRTSRPVNLTHEEVDDLLKRFATEPGWQFVEVIDPGWSDKCSVIFALVHPIKGIHIVHEFYESGRTVPQVAAAVHLIEQTYFKRIPHLRLYDPHHITKTTQESPVANYKLWRDSGMPGQSAIWSKDRSYDRMFELIFDKFTKFYPSNCKGLDRELRTHRKDAYGVPDEKGAHSVDNLRHLSNWFYERFYKKVFKIGGEKQIISQEKAAWLEKLEYYEKYVQQKELNKSNVNISGYNIKGINTNSIKGIKF